MVFGISTALINTRVKKQPRYEKKLSSDREPVVRQDPSLDKGGVQNTALGVAVVLAGTRQPPDEVEGAVRQQCLPWPALRPGCTPFEKDNPPKRVCKVKFVLQPLKMRSDQRSGKNASTTCR